MENASILKLIRFLESYNGRDKLVRTVQYFCKFYGWYAFEYLQNKDWKTRLASVESNLSLGRKAFRWGKSLSFFNNLLKAVKDPKMDMVTKSTSIVANFCLGIWMLYDHLIWAGKTKLIKDLDLKSISYRACALWITGLFLNIIKTAYALQKNHQKALKQPNQDRALETISEQQFDLSLDLVRTCLDVTIPLNTLSPSFSERVPSGVLGVLGLVSSLIGIFQVWKKTK